MMTGASYGFSSGSCQPAVFKFVSGTVSGFHAEIIRFHDMGSIRDTDRKCASGFDVFLLFYGIR